jgi:hypothetical protein
MISRAFEALLTMSGETPCRAPLAVQLNHDPDVNPFAINMLICNADGEELTEWAIGVDLFFDGSQSFTGHVGDGDVRIKAYPSGHLGVCLQSPEGHAHLGLPSKEVRAFLEEVGEAKPTGDAVEAKIDEALREIFGE